MWYALEIQGAVSAIASAMATYTTVGSVLDLLKLMDTRAIFHVRARRGRRVLARSRP